MRRETEQLVFRKIGGPEPLPSELYYSGGRLDEVELLLWFCPSLLLVEAEALAALRSELSVPLTQTALEAHVRRYLPAARAAARSSR